MDTDVLLACIFGAQVATLLVLLNKNFTKSNTPSKLLDLITGTDSTTQETTVAPEKLKAQPKKKVVAKKKPVKKAQPKKRAAAKHDRLEDLDNDIESLDDHEFDVLDDFKDR